MFNFILSNGTRSTQRDEGYPTKYTHMIPADTLNTVRSVTIHMFDLFSNINGFSFFDKDGALLWKIGDTTYSSINMYETVVLKENEVIVGVVAKLQQPYQSSYTDFQFQIALEWRGWIWNLRYSFWR